MVYTTEQIKNMRQELNQKIQSDFNKCTTYSEKLGYIIKVVLMSQQEYMKYTNNMFLTEDYCLQLLKELNEMPEMDDSKFIDFVQDKIIKPMNAGHLYIKQSKTIETEELIAAREKYMLEHKEELEKNKNIEINFLNDKSTVVVKIKSFSRQYLEEDRKILKDLEQHLSSNDYDNVVIDIRENTGGTDEYFELLSMFSSKPVFKRDNYRNLLTGENESVEWMAINGTGKDYNRYLLVDDKVFSTSESLTMLCKNTGFATVIGEPTRGEGYGATPFVLNISNSVYTGRHMNSLEKKVGLNLVFPIEAPINAMGEIDYANFYRIIPDIICPSEEALEVALNQIEHNQSITK